MINKMVNYDDAKIYKIVDNTNDNIYIGSTCKSLKRRLSNHKSNYERYVKGLIRNVRSFEIIKNDNYEIELLETCEVKTKEELLARERYFIENNNCLNKVIPGRSKKEYDKKYREVNKEKIKEYRETNKDKLKEISKEYYITNKEKIKEYRETNKDKLKEQSKEYRENNKEKLNQKIECECGGRYTFNHKARHLKTEMHQKFLNNL